MKILFLSQRVPYPPNRGDKISSWRIIDRFRTNHEVAIVAFAHDKADLAAADELRAMGLETTAIPINLNWRKYTSLPHLFTSKPITLGVYGSARLQREVDQRLDWADCTYAFSSSMGAFVLGKGHPWIMHFAELDSDKWRQYAKRSRLPMSWIYRREWHTLAAFERALAADSVNNVFCTPLEQRIFNDLIPGRPSLVARNGVDLEYFKPRPKTEGAQRLVFTGVMDYYPNVDGCIHFVQEVLPLVQAENPHCTLTIVGSKPTAAIRALAENPSVTVTGFVEDVRTYLSNANIAIAPLRMARGIQNKVLEAMAVGLPVVGTTSATQGVDGVPERDYLLADSAADQARAINRLLSEPEEARLLGARARTFVEECYDWSETLAPLDEVLASCLSER